MPRWTPLLIAVLLLPASVEGVFIDITSPTLKKTPVAIAPFKDLTGRGRTAVADEIREILISDLRFTGLFDIIPSKAYVEDPKKGIKEGEFDFSDWRIIGSELLIKGGYIEEPIEGCKEESDLLVEVRLYDVYREELLKGKRYCGSMEALSKMVHRFADEVIEVLTGEKGIFQTRLAFVRPGPGGKEIYISDYDGKNLKKVVSNGSINLSPQWSPDGRWLLYTSFKDGNPAFYMKNLQTGREIRVTNYPGINIGARWSPDGRKIALTLSIAGNPEIYIIDLRRRTLTRLTHSDAIDVSPTWSPDGRRIAFVSDRAGNPHIYVMDSNGKNLRRLTFKGRFNASPDWSPRGDRIVFSRLEGGKFDIWAINPDTGEEEKLTYGPGNNEDPSWSPDGRYIAFSSDRDGKSYIYILKPDGEVQRVAEGGDPSWSPRME